MTAEPNKSQIGELYGFDNTKDPSKRDFIASIVVGDKAQGKTSYMDWYVRMYLAKSDNLFKQGKIPRQRPILIWDSVDAFSIYEEITVEELIYGAIIPGSDPPMSKYWVKGVRRIVRRWSDQKEDEKALTAISKYFRNGLFVGDEIHDWMSPTSPMAWQTDMIKKHRNYFCDVLLGTQNLMDIPIVLRPHFWRYVLLKTPEYVTGVSWLANRRFPQPERFYEVWKAAAAAPEIPNEKIQDFKVFEKSHAPMAINSTAK